jgi:hypothetical protein
MKSHRQKLGLFNVIGVIGLAVLLGAASGAGAQTSAPSFFGTKSPQEIAAGGAPNVPHPAGVLNCKGRITSVVDVANEAFLFTPFNFNPANGGGEGGCFDPTPVLSTTVTIPQGATCLNAHFSAIVGSQQTYGPALAPLAVFQVTVTPLPVGAPQHLIGHFETPYNIPCPAIGIEAETDVDTFGSNFFQRVGTLPGDVPPGNYRVDVWWAGAPPFGAGGAFAGAFVLKLYGM